MQPEKVLASAIYKEWYPFDRLFDRCKTVYHPSQLDDVTALLLWGGEDISPSIYGQKPFQGRYCGPKLPSVRDRTEIDLANEAIRRSIPIIGICRGAQMMCALSGGGLFQHVNGHTGRFHTLIRDDGTEIDSNSLHHQMMDLRKVDHRLIAWTPEPLSHTYCVENGEAEPPEKEPEIAWIPKSKALCIQGHPEFLEVDNPFVKYCLELTEQYVVNNRS